MEPEGKHNFDPCCTWEAAPPGYSAPALELGNDWLHGTGATPAKTYCSSREKLEKYGNAGRCSQLWEESEMGLQRKIGTGI